MAGLVTGGEVRVHGCAQDRLVTAITTLNRMGAQFEITDDVHPASAPDGLATRRGADRHASRVHDGLADAAGRAVHPGRRHVGAARDGVRGPARLRAGAAGRWAPRSSCSPPAWAARSCRFHDTNALHSAVVKGVSKLRGAEVEVPDVRAGFSRSSPRQPPTVRSRCGTSTTSSGVTTGRRNSCGRWGWTCRPSEGEPPAGSLARWPMPCTRLGRPSGAGASDGRALDAGRSARRTRGRPVGPGCRSGAGPSPDASRSPDDRPGPSGAAAAVVGVNRDHPAGRKVQIVEASVSAGEVEVARVRALRIRVTPVEVPPQPPRPPSPPLPHDLPSFSQGTLRTAFAGRLRPALRGGRLGGPGPGDDVVPAPRAGGSR